MAKGGVSKTAGGELHDEKEIKEKIKAKLGLRVWSRRAQRALEYFKEYPDEIGHLNEYRVHKTPDGNYLARRPWGTKGVERIGVEIGADVWRGSVSHYFLYREVVNNE